MDTKPKPDTEYVVGIDLGGTNVRAAVMTRDGSIVGQARNPSEAKRGAAMVVGATADTVRQALDAAKVGADAIGAVGAAVPGHIDPKTGVIHWSPNFGEVVDGQFRIFLEVPFTAPLSEALGLAVYAGNDANVAALGEFRYGAGSAVKDLQDMVMLTLGTGIGCGVISGGVLVSGDTGGAVEAGHHVIVAGGRQCGCGTFGCLEAYCGTDAILERGLRTLEGNQDSALFERIQGDKMMLTPKMIDEAAQSQDSVALQVWEETGYYLGVGIANLVNIFNPRLVVIGGGIRQATGLLSAARRSMRRHAIYSLAHTCEIVTALLGEDAGMKGAGELAWRAMAGPR